MTITLQAVNELIQSLESAGELSIKETKVMALAKAFKQLAAENVVRQEFVKICFRAAADGASLDGSDIQEIGERLGLFGRETYQPMLHGYICGHEAGEDSVYVMKGAPATDRIVAGIKAEGVEQFAESQKEYVSQHRNEMDQMLRAAYAGSAVDAERFAKQLREGADK
ncbi:hypothetical protein [Klebsiella michiganensis]|uniref:hypothetical protein n=1 Tax=Klebsiella michiganensis TaxID=1134687 RepID=UPI00062C0894|nr:hypothetical protein [Klebsiella michiganensis]KKY66001.1 hypothetical protein OA42_24785 [Klebsiella michiganensis]